MGHPAIWPSGDPPSARSSSAMLLVGRLGGFRCSASASWCNLLRLGRPENRFDHLGDRIKYFMLMVLGQRGVLRDPLPGIAHFFTFWGFIIIQLDALNLWAMGFHFTIPIISSRHLRRHCSTSSSSPRSSRCIIFAFRRAGAAPEAVAEPVAWPGRRLHHPGHDYAGAGHALLLRDLRLHCHATARPGRPSARCRAKPGRASARAPPSR